MMAPSPPPIIFVPPRPPRCPACHHPERVQRVCAHCGHVYQSGPALSFPEAVLGAALFLLFLAIGALSFGLVIDPEILFGFRSNPSPWWRALGAVGLLLDFGVLVWGVER